jgi:hypothetical protein
MRIVIGFGSLVSIGVAAAIGFGIWVSAAPPMAFAASDLQKPGNPSDAERRALIEHCQTVRPSGIAPERHTFVCGCTADRMAKHLSRAEFVYVTHLSRGETRLAMSALKGFAAAGVERAEIEQIGLRADRILRNDLSGCFQASLTEADLDRIRGGLEKLGIVPRSTPPPP